MSVGQFGVADYLEAGPGPALVLVNQQFLGNGQATTAVFDVRSYRSVLIDALSIDAPPATVVATFSNNSDGSGVIDSIEMMLATNAEGYHSVPCVGPYVSFTYGNAIGAAAFNITLIIVATGGEPKTRKFAGDSRSIIAPNTSVAASGGQVTLNSLQSLDGVLRILVDTVAVSWNATVFMMDFAGTFDQVAILRGTYAAGTELTLAANSAPIQIVITNNDAAIKAFNVSATIGE